MVKAPVNKIIDCSVVDGPGNRTSVFLQGCNYHCTYCHNPETIHPCNNCGACVAVCPAGALALKNGAVCWDAPRCAACDSCLKICTHLSSPRVQLMTADEVLRRVARNAPFVRGVTASGGECTLHEQFLIALFTGARALGLDCLIDSNGSCDFSVHTALLDACDGVMLDVKSSDPGEYRAITGGDGNGILDKAVFLAKQGKLTEVRTVSSPDFQSLRTVREVSDAVAPYQSFGDIHYRIIAYRPFGVREPYRSTITPPDAAFLQALAEEARAHGMRHVSAV